MSSRHNAGSESLEIQPTVKDIQEAINQNHPFGLKIWKPALYRKHRSIEQKIYSAVHSIPGSFSNFRLYLSPGNIFYVLVIGWWFFLVYLFLAMLLLPLAIIGTLGKASFIGPLEGVWDYVILLMNLSHYCLWPFGKFISKSDHPLTPLSSSRLGRHSESTEFKETDPFIPSSSNTMTPPYLNLGTPVLSVHDPEEGLDDQRLSESWSNLYQYFKTPPSSEWTVASVLYYCLFFLVLAPLHALVSLFTFYGVFTIPISRMNLILLKHLCIHPNLLSVHSSQDKNNSRESRFSQFIHHLHMDWLHQDYSESYKIVLCLHHAMGRQYYKYTLDGVNILFINLLSLVIFTLVDFYWMGPLLQFKGIASPFAIFILALLSVIPLSYFIGMSVSSITAQTGSLALGAVINATFGSIVEVILYCFALKDGKEAIVEGSIIGSFLCGLLVLPGVAMFSNGLYQKEKKFNAKAANVTSTLLIIGLVGVFVPSLFQEIYGTFQWNCQQCSSNHSCDRCHFKAVDPINDPIYHGYTKSLIVFCCVALITTYCIGLLFTLRTHAATIYAPKNKKQKKQFKSRDKGKGVAIASTSAIHSTETVVERRALSMSKPPIPRQHGFSTYEPELYLQSPMFSKPMRASKSSIHEEEQRSVSSQSSVDENHSHPSWSTSKSVLVLLFSTILFALIAEILVACIDDVLVHMKMDQKFLGLTLFAIVPSVTEFYNAIAFAIQGNIVLSLEIASAYTTQVALVQIPIVVLFSMIYPHVSMPQNYKGLTLIFPRFDVCSVFLGTFLLTYVYIEGKSNYFKGSMLLLAYLIMMAGFWFTPSMIQNVEMK